MGNLIDSKIPIFGQPDGRRLNMIIMRFQNYLSITSISEICSLK